MKKILSGVAIAIAAGAAQPVFAQTSATVLTEAVIDRLSEAAWQEAKKQGVDISVSFVDEKGWPLYFKRYGDAMLITTVLVPNKAYTAAVLRMPSGDLAKLTQPSQPLYGINTVDPRVVLFAGGYPLFAQGKLIGAFGVGGGNWDQDEKIGQSVLKAFDAEIK